MAGRTNEQLATFNAKNDYKELTDEDLNMTQYFDPGEWEKNSPYEMRRLSNLARNFFFMKFMGWVNDNSKPSFMKTKRQRAAQNRAGARAEELEKDKDKEWRPRKPTVKKQFDPFLGPDSTKPRASATESRPPPLEPQRGPSGDDGCNRLQAIKVMKARIIRDNKPVKRKAPEPSRRSERNRERAPVNYDIPEEDRFIWCHECGMEVLDVCKKHPMVDVTDVTPEGRRTSTYAGRTIPSHLDIRESSIQNAGRGVFTKTLIRKNTRFGPYVGEEREAESDARDSGYAWAIYDEDDNLIHYCDARDPSKSNWMRFVNCANSESEQNLTAFQYRGEIFYKACKTIHVGQELLTYYGDEYAVELGLMKDDGTLIHPPKIDDVEVGDTEDKEDDAVTLEEVESSDAGDESDGSEYCAETEYEDEGSSEEEFVVPGPPPPKRRVPTMTTPAPRSGSSWLSDNVQRREERTGVPLAGNTRDMTEVPDLRQYYNTQTQRYSCPCCIHKISDYVMLNNLIQHIMKEHASINPSVFRVLMDSLYQLELEQKTSRSGMSSKAEIEKKVLSGRDEKTCGMCGKTFPHARHLARHVVTHTGEKPYKCDICGHGSTQMGDLKQHMRIHTGEKPYKCDICGHGSTTMGDLKKHMRIHTGEKPYKCDICGHGSTQMGHLKKHMRIHTGEKPYKCDICGHGSTEMGNLKQHMRIHTGEKPYKCDYCDQSFSFSSSRTQHMKRIHDHGLKRN